MIETVDCIVVGAGVVGLAIARRLAIAGREVIVLEAADDIGTGTSSRNSEVIRNRPKSYNEIIVGHRSHSRDVHFTRTEIDI